MIEIINMTPEEFRLGYERYLMELPREPLDKTKMLENLANQNKVITVANGDSNQHYDDYIKKLIKEGKARVMPYSPITLRLPDQSKM